MKGIKKTIRKLLNFFGYDFIKINIHSADKAKKTVPVKVGNYEILMPGNNAQISLYKSSPSANSQMARLAQLIFNRYNNSTMIDIGANVGDTIAVVRSETKIPIIAIEGDSFSYSFLQRNASKFEDVQLISEFLGEEKKQLKVTIEKKGWNNTLIPATNGTNVISINTLDNVLMEQQLEYRKIKLLKIDTEGFDTIILRGCKETILKNNPVLYFEYNGENMSKIGEQGFETIMNLKNVGYRNIYIFDCIDNLIMATTLDDINTIKQLHDYAHTNNTMIPYFDICIFHSEDASLANDFLRIEKMNKQR
jgi:FkbM family methyltransferase